MDQSSLPQPQPQPPYSEYPEHLAHLAHTSKPAALPQHAQSLGRLQSTLNLVIVETGKTIRSAVLRRNRNVDENSQRAAMQADTEKLRLVMAGTIPTFHNSLDEIEAEIVRARAIIGRDLRAIRAMKNMNGAEKAAEEKKAVDKEIEAAVDAMAEVADATMRETLEEAAGQQAHGQDDLHISVDHDMDVDARVTDSESLQAGHDITEAMKAGQTYLNLSDTLHNLDDLRVNTAATAEDMQQDIQFSDNAGAGQAPRQTQGLSPAIPLSLPPARQSQKPQQRQEWQHQRNLQTHQRRKSQAQIQIPGMQQNRMMPEDNIAFGALPGSTVNSPKQKEATIPNLGPASHHVVTQQGGLNIPAEALPLLPEHIRDQMAQVHNQAVLEASGVHPNMSGQVMDGEFFLADTTSPAHPHTPSQFGNQSTSRPPQQNTSQPQQQPTLASPFEPQSHSHPLPQQQNQQSEQQQQPPAAPQPAHDEINFGAMFAADGHQNAAETDINFDDFFNDIVGKNGQGSGSHNAGAEQVDGLDGVNESGAADFDLSTFGLEHDNTVGGEKTVGDMAVATTVADMGSLGGMGNAGAGGVDVGLGLGMLEGLESYANQATDDDAMDGLNFGGGLQMGNEAGNFIEALGGQQQGDSGNANVNVEGGFGNAADGAFGMSNADLDTAMSLSMDQGTSFDDLLDGMDFGGEGGDGSGGNGNAETSEFDDAFFGL